MKSDSNGAETDHPNHPNSVGILQVWKSTDTLLRSSLRSVTYCTLNSGVGVAKRMASSWIHCFDGGWTPAQERIHCQLSTGVPVRDRYDRFWGVWIICWSSHHVDFFPHRSYWKFKKGGQKGGGRENGCQASEPVRWLRNHMGTPTISPHCEVAAGGSSKSSCVYCGFQSPKPSVLIENLRNSSGERMSLLRGNPLSALHTDYIQMMLELSKEQGFEVTYFNIGKPMSLLVSMQQGRNTVYEQQSEQLSAHCATCWCNNALQRSFTKA